MIGRLPFAARLVVRGCRRRPLFFATAALTIGVGMGAFLMAASLARSLLLSPLPGVTETAGLVRLELAEGSSAPNIADLAAASRTLESTAAFLDALVDLEIGPEPTRGVINLVTEEYFATLRLDATIGTLELTAPDQAVLAASLWKERLGGDPTVLGRRILINGLPVTVVGVAPEGFSGTFRVFAVDAWVPLALAPQVVPGFDPDDRGHDRLEAFARLAAGTTTERAAQEVALLGRRLREAHPDANRELEARIVPLTGFDEELRGAVVGMVAILLGLSIALLAVAVGNLTGLLVARSLGRSREMAIYSALGAGPRQLVTTSLGEGLLIAFAGSGVGYAIARGAGFLWQRGVPALPLRISLDLAPDAAIAGAAAIVTAAVGVATGLPGALRALRTAPRSVLAGGRAEGRERGRLRGLLVALQIAGAVALLGVGALFVRALERQAGASPGFDPAGVAVAQFVDLTATGAGAEEATRRFGLIRERLAADPQITGAAWSSALPFLSVPRQAARRADDPEGEPVPSVVSVVSPQLFAVLRLPILGGRAMSAADSAATPRVAWVDVAIAERLWPDREPTGQHLLVEGEAYLVAGVVGGLRRGSTPRPAVYLPLAQHPSRRLHLLARSAAGTAPVAIVRDILREAEPGVAPPPIGDLTDLLALSFLPQRIAARAGVVLGGVGLVLALTGLTALLVFLVSERRRELAIRASLGATPRRVILEVLRWGLTLAGAGWLVGILIVAAAGRALAGLLLGVEGTDAAALGLVTLALLLALLPAFWLPVRRLLHLDLARLLAAH